MQHPIVSISAYHRGNTRVIEITRRIKHLKGWKTRKRRKTYLNPTESSWRRAVRASESLYITDPKYFTCPPKNNGAKRGPLRKLIEIVLVGEGRDKWLLECGHQMWVNDSTIYRARCWRCKRTKEAND